MVRQKIVNLLQKSLARIQRSVFFPHFNIVQIQVWRPEDKKHGDYATNVALLVAKASKKPSMEIANLLRVRFLEVGSAYFEKVDIAPPGFINFWLSREYLWTNLKNILEKEERYGELNYGQGQRINLEFISANPTGPLTLGNGRGGFLGDVLANVFNKAGFVAKREYYINDVGEQIKKLGHSVLGDSEACYKGEYIENLRKKIKDKDPSRVGEKAAQLIIKELIKPSVEKMGINFDVWFSEKKLYDKKETDKAIVQLTQKNLTYEKDSALWFKSTEFGDDKDRVLVKENGEKTYFVSDIAYFKNKFDRKFDRLIYILGADHYGYVARLRAIAEVMGYESERIDIIVMQLVRLFEAGKEVRMSKRTGNYVTLDELINEVGLDVSRFFFLMRSPGNHLNFDLDLAKEHSEKNPVYYVQYAHARICSILNQAGKIKVKDPDLPLLIHQSELTLIKELMKFPEVVEDTAQDYQVQRIPRYAMELAAVFHQFYRDCKVMGEDEYLTQARLALIIATKSVLKNTLNLMGISAPEKM